MYIGKIEIISENLHILCSELWSTLAQWVPSVNAQYIHCEPEECSITYTQRVDIFDLFTMFEL